MIIPFYVCGLVYEYLYQPWHGRVCHETEMWGGVTLATDVFSSSPIFPQLTRSHARNTRVTRTGERTQILQVGLLFS